MKLSLAIYAFLIMLFLSTSTNIFVAGHGDSRLRPSDKKQSQIINLEDIAYKIGQNIMA